jgi:hypothetical protein
VNAEVRERWLAKLRSGDYAQGRGGLRSDATGDAVAYCCLGVLCEVAREDDVVTLITHEPSDYYVAAGDSSDENGGYLPKVVAAWAGLGSINPIVNGVSLSDYNDIRHYSFEAIADLVERYL